ncbi:hypothetical protein WR25_00271 isoform D [Diploscapter pachys]|nr:hypothetical protein WR25_00271 isoform D [Diploscapter pachys]
MNFQNKFHFHLDANHTSNNAGPNTSHNTSNAMPSKPEPSSSGLGAQLSDYDRLVFTICGLKDRDANLHEFADVMASNLGPVESEFYVKMAYDAMRSMLHDRFTSCGNALIIYIKGLSPKASHQTPQTSRRHQEATTTPIATNGTAKKRKLSKVKPADDSDDEEPPMNKRKQLFEGYPYHFYFLTPIQDARMEDMVIVHPDLRMGNIRAAIIEATQNQSSIFQRITDVIRKVLVSILNQIIPFNCDRKYTLSRKNRGDTIRFPPTVSDKITLGIIRSIKLFPHAVEMGYTDEMKISSQIWTVLVRTILNELL